MAAPGFSISDLIQALGQVKRVYDAFTNEYTGTEPQLRDLTEDIDQFRANLKKHKEILEERGLEYSGFEAVYRTLNQCTKFLDEYKDVLGKQRGKSSVAKAIKIAKFTFEQDEINRLRGQIARHESNILHFSVNLVLENSFRRAEQIPATVVAEPLPIPGASLTSNSPPPTPVSLGSPLLSQDAFRSPPSSTATGAPSTERPRAPAFESPRASTKAIPIMPRSRSSIGSSSSTAPSPQHRSAPRHSQNGTVIPGLVLPQAALPYRVAEVYFASKKVDLKRKPAGRDYERGREMVIIDQDGNPRFKHRIRVPPGGFCFPYTWHRRWQTDHDALEVGFKDSTGPEGHSVSFKGMPAIYAVPKYIFSEQQDFEDFQSEVRGKRLEGTFEVRQIMCAASSRNGEATDQHLKIWRDYGTQECSISYYASAVPKPRHLEFPLMMFEQQLAQREAVELCMSFIGAEPKRARTFSKAFSRSPTERTTSSSNTTVPGVFTRNNTGIASSASSVTTTSRMSVASFQSEAGPSQSARSNSGTSIESQAKQMKYLKIEFSDEAEAMRFRQVYERLYQEEISRPPDFFLNWQMSGSQQRPESVISTSPAGTPFTMSPELRPMRGHVGQEDT